MYQSLSNLNSAPLRLVIDGTEPFELEFTSLVHGWAVVRFTRQDVVSLLLVVACATEGFAPASMNALQQALGPVAGEGILKDAFLWMTSVPPPLAAMMHVGGNATNGMDLLGMCLAARVLIA
jgi:hypothetical protein